jgi:SDR family mycofactocin-dependent oxidoreductase
MPHRVYRQSTNRRNQEVGKLDRKVAFITGAARGQGRSLAIRLAEEGADIIAVDIAAQIDSVPYPMSTPEDLADTAKEVEALGRRIFTAQADVRDEAALKKAFEQGTAAIGPVDIVLANAGTGPMAVHEGPRRLWQDVIDVNLYGVFNTVEIAIPSMIERSKGGAIVVMGSTASLLGLGGPSRSSLAYTAAKHGVLGSARSYANTLAQYSIRVSSVHMSAVQTPMIVNDVMKQFLSKVPNVSKPSAHALPIDMLEPADITNAVLWLVSDDARYVTGVALPVDAGYTNKK